MKNKRYLNIKLVLISILLVSISCQKVDHDTIQSSINSNLRQISLTEIPEGIQPLEFNSIKDAEKFLSEIRRERENQSVVVNIVDDEAELYLPNFPRTRSSMEGGVNNLDPKGWWFQSLNAYISYSSPGESVNISSAMVGFTFSVGWEQHSYTYSWSGNTINYTIYGTESVYMFVQGVGQIYSNSVQVSGSYTHR